MKNLKITFLFIFVFIVVEKAFSTPVNIDSLEFHITAMKKTELPPNIAITHANRALNWANKMQLNSKRIEIFVYKRDLYRKLKQYDSVLYFTKKILKSFQLEDYNKRAYEYSMLGYYYMLNSQKDSAYYSYVLSNDNYSKIGDTLKIGQNLSQIASIQSKYGDYEASDISAIESLKYIAEDNKVYRAYIYNRLAISSRLQKDYKEAIYWYDKALEYTDANKDSIIVLQNKANAFRDFKNYNASIRILDSLRNVGGHNDRTRARIIDNLAYTRWLNGEHQNDPSDFLIALDLRIKNKELFGLNASYSHLSEFYKKNNPKLALLYASKMYQLATDQKSPQDQLEALEKLIDLDNSRKLIGYYAAYKNLSDSLHTVEKLAKNKFAKIKYDSEKNREDNLQLKINASEKELELQQEKTRNTIGAVSSGSVLMLLMVFGYFRIQKHQQEKRAEVYKTETRIAKKIHDEVANNMVNIMNRVQYVDEPKEKLLDDLEKVYLLTRNISHQNKTIETGEKYTASLKSLLTNFNSKTTTILLKNIQNVGLEQLSETKQIEIYRILQELLVNMQKHSEAKLVALTFEKERGHLSINYSDNGVGVDLKSLQLKNGLSNVETRIKSIHGNITFTSSLNKGFKASMSFK